MKQNQLLKLGKEKLKKANVEEAESKAKRLLEFLLQQSPEEMIRNSLEEVLLSQEKEYQEKLNEIIQGKPLQYITQSQEFMGLNFLVDENVLIPQPDTEILVEQTLIKVKKIEDKKIQILDLCTGSGAIGISIAKQLQDAILNKGQVILEREYQIFATDISKKALEIAQKNAVQNQVQIQLIQSDMFSNLKGMKFDVIVSNPPYIETSIIDTLNIEVRQEPRIALDGGKDGLKFYRTILKSAENYLKQNGYLLLEIGYNQGKKIIELWQELKTEHIELITKQPIKDLGNNDRVIIFQYQ